MPSNCNDAIAKKDSESSISDVSEVTYGFKKMAFRSNIRRPIAICILSGFRKNEKSALKKRKRVDYIVHVIWIQDRNYL